ncbi:MAG: fused MFS/spermidine synthase [Archangium sp.]|nr:fused MFS/spermidine synthase [Archangium sp.]
MPTLSRPTALTLVFFSGATGLLYEFCWSKRLANWLGNTGQAHAILLATFMGGLALGAWLFGRRADRSARPLALYGILEIGVGLLALLFPTMLDLAGSLYVSVGSAGGNPARMVLAAVTVLPPTLLMGGSLPAMTRALTQSLATAKGTLASLYAINSLGAAVGSLLAGVFFVPVAGLAVTERFAVFFNLLVGVIAILGSRAPAVAAPEAAYAAPQRVYTDLAVKAVLIGTALSGFTAMLYEVTWIRLLSIIIGGTSYAFTLILSCFILGIAIGSFWIARRPEGDALRTFGWLQLALVVVVCLTIPLYRRLPFVFFQLTQLLRPEDSWSVYLFLTFVFCGLLLIPPTALMGASFPLGARVVMRSKDSVGGEVGRVYLFNTIGTILGSLAGGLVLLPLIGLEGNFTVGLIANLIAAAVCLRVASKTNPPLAAALPPSVPPSPRGGEGRGEGRHLLPLLAVTALVLFSAVTTRGWATFISQAGRFREWHGHFTQFAAFEKQAIARADSLFYADDVFASVMVAQQKGNHRFLRINGKADGSNGRGDLDTQTLAAHLGVLTHPGEVKKVLLVGIGAGITAGSLLAHGIERLDVVEISPAVLDAAKLFSADNRNALEDPRCHVHIEDARTFLTLSPEKYDLIVSVPSNPWVTGVSGLFSRDFFRVARDRLAPGGRMVQWIHTYESNEALVKLVVRTLRDSFEHGTTWLGAADMLLVASREPQTFDPEVMSRRMRPAAVAEDLRRLGITRVSTLLARQVHSDEGQLAFAGQGQVNTDDHNVLEYLSPIAYFMSGEAVSLFDERIEGGALVFAEYAKEHPLDAAAWGELYETLHHVHGEEDPLLRSVAERWVAESGAEDAPSLALARTQLAQDDLSAAVRTLMPKVNSDTAAPEAVTLYLQAVARLNAQSTSVFQPPAFPVDLEQARRVLAANPNDAGLREAIDSLTP